MRQRKTNFVRRWGILWYSINSLDGVTRRIMWHAGKPLLFFTRREARAYIRERYGYIAHRPDLTAEPHGWRMPQAVRVKVYVEPE